MDVGLVTSLELVRSGQGYREAVLDSLVSGHFLDELDARHKAEVLGLTDARPYRIGVARVNGPGRQVPKGALPFLAIIRGPELAMLLPAQGRPLDLAKLLPTDVTVTFGISDPTCLPEHAPRALLQAQDAVDLGLRLGRAGQTISYEELGIYRLLLQIGDLRQLRLYAEDVLGPLIDYDSPRRPDLLRTLSIYLNQHESLKQTARVLRVHVNTVAYRIRRIESLTSLDLTDPDDRLTAHVATKIIEAIRRPGLLKRVHTARSEGDATESAAHA